ncbi:hypothetical protein Holit_02064 [Hollandina sp. SP2]
MWRFTALFQKRTEEGPNTTTRLVFLAYNLFQIIPHPTDAYLNLFGQDTRYAEQFQCVQIACCGVVRIITSRYIPDGFFYLDLPYVDIDQGHYDGYTQDDFDALLSTLEGLKGKFLLSSYWNQEVMEYTRKNGWT